MPLSRLDHVTIRTANLAAMARFYEQVLGLAPGPRPPFTFAGAWLYCGARAALHLVEVAPAARAAGPGIEHFAFAAEGLAEFLAGLRRRRIAYRTAVVPGFGLRQVHLSDPDGNHVEITFAAEEPADPAEFPGATA